jgi:hypothetical protein
MFPKKCILHENSNPISILQQDLARAADEAAMEYERTTPAEERSAEGVWEAMNAAEASLVKSIKSKDFHKYLTVGNPKHGDGFFDEVRGFFEFDMNDFHLHLYTRN